MAMRDSGRLVPCVFLPNLALPNSNICCKIRTGNSKSVVARDQKLEKLRTASLNDKALESFCCNNSFGLKALGLNVQSQIFLWELF